MTDRPTPFENNRPEIEELPYREVEYGRVYDTIEPNKGINIAIFNKTELVIDEENLGLEAVSLDALERGWERVKDEFTRGCIEQGIKIDPFTVFKYYHIQRKTFQILGKSTENAQARDDRLLNMGDRVNLSETVGHAMCSEYAILAGFIAQKVGEPIKLIMGSLTEDEGEQWRNFHAFLWIDGLNIIFDSAQSVSPDQYPVLMIPSEPTSFETLEKGYDVKTKSMVGGVTVHYGLEAMGFGVEHAHDHPNPSTDN